MPFEYRSVDCLTDIVDNAERIAQYVEGLDYQGFEQNGLTRDAVERCVERICEAVHRLGMRKEALMPGQPWEKIRGMANRLRHAYDRISLDVLWATVCFDVPSLAAAAREALTGLEDSAD